MMLLLLILVVSFVGCYGNQNCVWNWGEWNPCLTVNNKQANVTTNQGTRDRWRTIKQLPDLGQGDCPPGVIDTQQCTPTQDAPAPQLPYCSQPEMTSCINGYCIISDLWCNSDDDCMDNSDEGNCTITTRPCNFTGRKLPSEEGWARGFDHVTGKFRGHVMNTGFVGSCDLRTDSQGETYRTPWNVKSYHKDTDAIVNTRMMESWEEFIKHVIKKYPFPSLNSHILSAFSKYSNQSVFLESTLSITKEQIILKGGSLKPHNEFHKNIYELPSIFQYTPYFAFIDKYGTHYSRDIHIGGEVNIVIAFDACTEHSKLTNIRNKLHRSLEKKTFADTDLKSFQFIVIYNDQFVMESPDSNAVKVYVDNLISNLMRDSDRGKRFIHHDRKGVDEEQLHRLLDSKYMIGIPHISKVKTNLIRATNQYLGRYSKSLCPHCENGALVVHDEVTSQDGCLCLDLSATYDQSLCPPIGGDRNLALPIIVGVVGVVLVVFIFLIAVYTRNTYKHPTIKKPLAPVGSKEGLDHAAGLASLPDGHILVTDTYHVYRFNPVGEEVSSTKKQEVNLSKPRGVTFHPDDNVVIVCEYGKNSLTSLGPNLDGIKKRRPVGGSPIDVTTLENGNLVVIMDTNEPEMPETRVVEMLSSNPEEGTIVRWSHESLEQPSHLAVGYSNIVLTDSSTGNVLKFTPNGMKYEDFNCQLEAPQGLCCLPDGRYLVCSKENTFDYIAVLDADGHRLPLRAEFHKRGQSGALRNIACSENMVHITLLFDNQVLVYKLDDFVSNIRNVPAPKSPLARLASRV